MFIKVVPYDPLWKEEFEAEAQNIRNILKDSLIQDYCEGKDFFVKQMEKEALIWYN